MTEAIDLDDAGLALAWKAYRASLAQSSGPSLTNASKDAIAAAIRAYEAHKGRVAGVHASDCATNSAPALEPGPCDCGAVPSDVSGDTSILLDVAVEALRIIAGEVPCINNLMGNVDIALEALTRIRQAKGGA